MVTVVLRVRGESLPGDAPPLPIRLDSESAESRPPRAALRAIAQARPLIFKEDGPTRGPGAQRRRRLGKAVI